MTHDQRARVGIMTWLWPTLAAAQDRPSEWGWTMHPMWGMWGAWGIGMMLMILVFWGVVIVGIVLLIRWLMTQGRESRVTDPATLLAGLGVNAWGGYWRADPLASVAMVPVIAWEDVEGVRGRVCCADELAPA